MKNLIEQMYYGKLAPYADPPPKSARAKAAQERYEQAYDALVNKLEPELRRELHRLLEARTEESSYDMAASFVQGYCLGARMTLDTMGVS